MNGVIYGIEVTGDGSVTITVTVLWLWWMVVTLLAGLFMTWTGVREWAADVWRTLVLLLLRKNREG